MAKPDETRQLSVKQRNAIDLLIQGKSDREAAEAVGVSRQTVNDWRNRNAEFVAELNRRRQDVWGSQAERLRQLVSLAVDVLEADLSDDSSFDTAKRRRQAAAVHVLRAAGLYGQKLEPGGPTNALDVEAGWARMKAWDATMQDLDEAFAPATGTAGRRGRTNCTP